MYQNKILIITIFLIILYIVYNKKEHFCSDSRYATVPDYYMYKDIKPFGYGYRPYYGYNLYMYSNSNNLMYSRPTYDPIYDYNYDINKTFKFPFKLYGMY